MEQIKSVDVKRPLEEVRPIVSDDGDIALETLQTLAEERTKLESNEPILQSEDDIGVKKEPEPKLKL